MSNFFSGGGNLFTSGASVAKAVEAVVGLHSTDGGDAGSITISGTSNPLVGPLDVDTINFAANARLQTNFLPVRARRIIGVEGSPGVIEFVGNAGAASGTAGAITTAGPLGTNIAGGAGGTAAGTAGGNGANVLSQYGKQGVLTDEYKGGAGGLGSGGAGGAGGTSTGLGLTVRDYGRGGSKNGLGVHLGQGALTTNTGGAGGGGGGGDGTAGGGGGASGGFVLVTAGYISDMIIRSKGGAGGSPAAGNRGGGGGGSGARVRGIFGKTVRLQYDVSGGDGGAKTGTGVDGSDGSCGAVEHSSYLDIGRSSIVLLGDSILDNTYRGSTSHLVLAGPRLCRNVAHTGDTLVAQLTAWQGTGANPMAAFPLTGRGQPSTFLKASLIAGGTNDLRAGASAATCLTRLTDLYTDVANNNPGIRIFIARVCPAKSHYDAIDVAIYARWQTFNASIDALNGTIVGSSTITTISGSDTALNDGSGNLQSQYDSGDGLHPSRLGEFVLAGELHAIMVANGF